MKRRIFTSIVLSLTCAINTYAQKQDTTVLCDGNLTYFVYDKEGRGKIYESAEMREAQRQPVRSYTEALLDYPNDNDLEELFNGIFSKERVEELKKFRIVCMMKFNSVDGCLAYMNFWIGGDVEMQLTLEELDKVEKMFKSIKYKFSIKRDGINEGRATSYTIPIPFKRLHKSCE